MNRKLGTIVARTYGIGSPAIPLRPMALCRVAPRSRRPALGQATGRGFSSADISKPVRAVAANAHYATPRYVAAGWRRQVHSVALNAAQLSARIWSASIRGCVGRVYSA